jgi:DNA primase
MPQFDLNKLLDAVDLSALAQKYGAKFSHKTGRDFRCACPLHKGKNPTAFSVYRDNNDRWHWHCYTDCDAGGDALEFLKRAENLTDFGEVVTGLADYAHMPLADIGFTPERVMEIAERKKRTEVLDLAGRYFASQLWSAAGAEALAYVRGRAFTDDTLRMAGWGFSDGGAGLKNYLEHTGADMDLARKLGLVRADGLDFTANQDGQKASPTGWLIYPHRPGTGGLKRQACETCQAETWHAKAGKQEAVCLRHEAVLPPLSGLEYFSSRALAPTNPKDKSRNLPGARSLYKAEVPGWRKVILVEGPADAESMRQLGYSAWALCGLGALPEEDVRLLKQRPTRYLALDGDESGQTKVPKIANLLGPLTMLVAPFADGKDANAFLQAEGTSATVQVHLDQAVVWIEKLLEKTDKAAPDHLVELTTQIAVLLLELPDSLAPRYYNQAGKKLSMTKKELQALANAKNANATGLSLSSVQNGQITFLGEPLANFSARITHELTRDNGQDLPEVEYTITGRLTNGTPLAPITIPAEQFAGMDWLARYWGARLISYLPKGKSGLLARAIQELSLDDLAQERVYTHTGIRQINGQYGYLSAAGFLTADGLDESIRVDLGGNNLRHYRLMPLPDGEALKKAVRASLAFLNIGPRHVTAPLWAAMYAAPLTEMLPLYTVLWVYGVTQSGKSTVTHLALTHFGPGFISGRQYHAPDNWESTLTALEHSMFTIKDAPVVIDDYAPQFASAQDAREMGRKAQKLIRSVGNRAARGRSTANLTQQVTRIPRGLVMVTAELPLPGESTVGRMLYVPIERGEVLPLPGERTRPILEEAQTQAQAGLYAQAMAVYLQWLVTNWEQAKARFLEIVKESVTVARQADATLQNRLPDYYGLLDAAQQLALTAFVEMGVLSVPEALEIANANATAILGVVRHQAEKIAAESPVKKFFESLNNLLERKKVYLAPRTNKVIYDPPLNADLIGYYDPDNPELIYLNDDTCLTHVREYWQKMGENFDTTKDAFRRQIAQISGLLAKRGDRDLAVPVWIKSLGRTSRVLVVSNAKLNDLYGLTLKNGKLADGEAKEEPIEDENDEI